MTKRKWDLRFMDMARLVASWSKDPSTKCGAVITDNLNRVVSVGFNGFPMHVDDQPKRYEDRETKLMMVLHAEVNAIMFANRSLLDCTLYVHPMPPCSRCACQIIQSGITRVVALSPTKELVERWGKDIAVTEEMFKEAMVKLAYIKQN